MARFALDETAPEMSANPAPERRTPSLSGGTNSPAEPRQIGDYELLEEIGRGGMGVVHRARQVSLNRIVAVKSILTGAGATTEAIRRFQAEAEVLARLRHPNIVAVHEIFEVQGQHFFSMEFVAGRNLAEHLRDHPDNPTGAGVSGRIPQSPTARYASIATQVARVAAAVHYAHEQGILHRDLKPSNILVDENDEPRVTDFGLAKRLAAHTDVSFTGQVVGSPQYFAPEQFSPSAGEISPCTDVFALGAVLYHLLTGRPPRDGETLEAVLLQLVDFTLVRPRQLQPAIPRDLETICLKCMAMEPARRYGSAREVAEDLERFLGGQLIRARPTGVVERGWHWARRHPGRLAAGTAILLLIATAVAAWLRIVTPPDPGQVERSQTPTPVFHFRDESLDDTNWSLAVIATGTRTIQTARQASYTNFPGPVRAVTNYVAAGSQVQGFHLFKNAHYDPARRGPLRAVSLRLDARQVDGVTGTQVGACLFQNGRYFRSSRFLTLQAGDLGDCSFLSLSARDFSRGDGTSSDSPAHPDFSPAGAPLQFGFVISDSDARRGHFGWSVIRNVDLQVYGPPPSAFPFVDDTFRNTDWTVLRFPEGAAGATSNVERVGGGHPGRCLRITTIIPRNSSLQSVYLSTSARYWPALQGPLKGVSIGFVLKEEAASQGRQVNPNLRAVVAQGGRLYLCQQAQIGTYTPRNRGWDEFKFQRLPAAEFVVRLEPTLRAGNPDFTTNGGPLRFGFLIEHTSSYRHDTNGFAAVSHVDNFRVEVERATPQ